MNLLYRIIPFNAKNLDYVVDEEDLPIHWSCIPLLVLRCQEEAERLIYCTWVRFKGDVNVVHL